MKKLYLGKAVLDIVFESSSENQKEELKGFLKEQYGFDTDNHIVDVTYEQITERIQIPPDWFGSGIYGTDYYKEAEDALEEWRQQEVLKSDPEYQYYLRLKEKFKDIE